MQEITPLDLDTLLKQEPKPLLLDVREPWEFEICKIEGARNIPMAEIPGILDEFDRQQAIVVICHHGMRSMQVALFLESSGFTDIHNLHGGMHLWAETVDPGMARY